MTQPSLDLDRILRWEQAGGEWRVSDESDTAITVSLLRCDGGEEVDRLRSSEADVRAYTASES